MSQRREKRKRRERRLEYTLELRCWQNNEPPKILFWRWRKWYRCDLWEFTGLRQTNFGLAPGPINRPPQSWRYVEEELWND